MFELVSEVLIYSATTAIAILIMVSSSAWWIGLILLATVVISLPFAVHDSWRHHAE